MGCLKCSSLKQELVSSAQFLTQRSEFRGGCAVNILKKMSGRWEFHWKSGPGTSEQRHLKAACSLASMWYSSRPKSEHEVVAINVLLKCLCKAYPLYFLITFLNKFLPVDKLLKM